MVRRRKVDSCASSMASRATPPMLTVPLVGVSSPASGAAAYLPDPLAPVIAELAGSHVRAHLIDGPDGLGALLKNLGNLGEPESKVHIQASSRTPLRSKKPRKLWGFRGQ